MAERAVSSDEGGSARSDSASGGEGERERLERPCVSVRATRRERRSDEDDPAER
jgi:hypothetical protein